MAVTGDLPQLESRAQFENAENSIVYDINGERIATLTNNQGRILVEKLMLRREQELSAIVARMTPAEQEQLMRALQPFNEAANSDLWPRQGDAVTRDPRLHEWGM